MVGTGLSVRGARAVGGKSVVAAHRLSAVSGALVVALAALVVLARTGNRVRAHTAATLLLVVLADNWGPYYHPCELAARIDLHPCGSIVQVGPLRPESAPRPWAN